MTPANTEKEIVTRWTFRAFKGSFEINDKGWITFRSVNDVEVIIHKDQLAAMYETLKKEGV